MHAETRIVGHLGDDPELTNHGGTPRCYLSVATTRRWTGKDGTNKEETTWYPVIVWGSQADACGRYLAKGRLVLVCGHMRCYTTEEGGPRRWELSADRVVFLSSPRGGKERETATDRRVQASQDARDRRPDDDRGPRDWRRRDD